MSEAIEKSLELFYQAYGAIIPEQDQWWFLKDKPLPLTAWANTLRVSLDELVRLLRDDHIDVDRLPGMKQALIYHGNKSRLTKHWSHTCGLFQVQEWVAMLAGQILSPKPDERVLDLCSAPGNKMAQMALSMKNQGLLIANDIRGARLRASGQLIKRLGLYNVSMSLYDGRHWPRLEQFFDKILVDAPCSGEGTFRKSPSRVFMPDQHNSEKMAAIQSELLNKAYRLLKPGGQLLYATCTFSPIENERVVDGFLKTHPAISLSDVSVDYPCSSGLTQWQDDSYDPSLCQAIRLWPHQNNSGGFFFALMKKSLEVDACMSLPGMKHQGLSDEDAGHLSHVMKYYDFPPEIFKQFSFFSSSRGIMMVNQNHHVPEKVVLDACGQLFLKTQMRHPKITTTAALTWAPWARAHVVNVNDRQRAGYMNREDQVIEPSQVLCAKPGSMVLVRFERFGLGCGYVTLNDNQWVLQSLFPKSMG